MLLQVTAAVAFTTTCVSAGCWRNTVCMGPATAAFPGAWDADNYSPTSRSVSPKYILSLPSAVRISDYKSGSKLTASAPGLVYDFGIEVGGIVTINYTLTGKPTALSLAFAESKNFVGQASDHSNAGSGVDGYLLHNVTLEGPGTYTMPTAKLRGGFRYLTLFQIGNSILELTDIKLEISFRPTWANLRAYQGYFHSSDTDLNRIWYAGAYTVQTNAIAPSTGRSKITSGWSNDATAGSGDTILVDGAKRDRWVWPGDMGISTSTAFASTGDLASARNALQAIENGQVASGELPYAGPPYYATGSDTYHMWTLIGTYQYVLLTDDLAWLNKIWPKYLRAINFIYAKVDSTGLLQATGAKVWGRAVKAVNGSAPNMLLHRTLTTGAYLSKLIAGSEALSADYTARARNLTNAIQKYLWDPNEGAFKDIAAPSTIYPQDANSLALALGIVPSLSAQAESISNHLTRTWTPIGPSSPELPGNISPFITSLEIQAHFLAGHPDRALELVKTVWGWILDNPSGTQSTMVEGYRTDGTYLYRVDSGYRNDASYISHSHSWSSGPTSALTQYLVGLWPGARAGAEWELRPSFFGVEAAEAGFTTPLGKFQAQWTVSAGKAVLKWSVPAGTSGWVQPRSIDGDGMRVTGGSGSLTYTL